MIEARLDRLPQELIDQIASEAVVYFDDEAGEFLQDTVYFDEEEDLPDDKLADLANLSRTCRRLSVACAPTLFRRVTFRWEDTRILYFLQSLTSKSSLGKYVRVFKARGGERGGKEAKTSNAAAETVLNSDPVDASYFRKTLRHSGASSSFWHWSCFLISLLSPLHPR